VTVTSDDEDRALWRACFAAAGEPAVDDALRKLYQALDEAVTAKGPVCWISGRCCNFDPYGHRLYVTALEIAWVTRQVRPKVEIDLRGACAFQVGGMCSIHAVRPLGCRVFFCQEGTQDWQHDIYEAFMARLRALHDDRGVPYRYMEWRAGLAEAIALQEPQ